MKRTTTHTVPASGLRRTALALAAGALLASVQVHAQQSTGAISGQGKAGDVVTVVNKSIGISRQMVVDSSGTFGTSQLPTGEYVVTIKRADGSTSTQTVYVQPGKGSSANFNQLEQVVVTGTAVKTIDVKSVESATLLSKAELDRIPVARNTTAIALLAPGATLGDGRIGSTNTRSGNVASLGGASPAENAYYINGFNVTNIVNGIAFNSVPFEGIGNQQVKTGGYGAEYGRSLGGVISVTTKRGTDEWHGGANITLEPRSLAGKSVYAKKDNSTSTNPDDWYLANRPGGSDKTQVNVWAGGPLIKDTLYGFALVQGANEKSNGYGFDQQTELHNSTPQYLVKLDWNVNKSNLLEFTAFNDKSTDELQTWKSPKAYETERGNDMGTDKFTTGGETSIVKWTSWLTDDLTLSALYGVGKYNRTSSVPSADCNYVRDARVSPAKAYGCATASSITDPRANDKRVAYRVDLEYVLNAKHTLRAGLDSEVYDTVDGTVAPGPNATRYIVRQVAAGKSLANGYVNNTGATQAYVEARRFENGGTFKTENSAWYVEDNYQVTKNLLLNVGLRNEAFKNKNADGVAFIDVKQTLAPRLGVAWDTMGNGDLKVYGNYGRYYIPVYANTNVRLSGKQTDYTDYYAFNETFGSDKYQLPTLGTKLGGTKVNSSGAAPDPRTIVDPDIKPMYQDEFIIGMQKALARRWTVGVKYTHRALKNSMDDICSGAKPSEWALANGYSAAEAQRIGDTIEHCFLANPGRDLTANVNVKGDGKLVPVTIPHEALGFPEMPKRTYDALEFMFERSWDKQWSFQGSYVLAYSKGNTEGYVKSDIGQDDAGISQDWDYPGLMTGANGYLPNDRRHTIKLWGSYAANDEWRLGANLTLQSGRPKNCFGYPADPDDPANGYGSSSFYCDGKPTPRGSQGRLGWFKELNLQATYTPRFLKGATFSVDLLNVFDTRTVRGIEEQGEQAAGTPSPAYGRPIADSIQRGRRVRLLAQYEF